MASRQKASKSVFSQGKYDRIKPKTILYDIFTQLWDVFHRHVIPVLVPLLTLTITALIVTRLEHSEAHSKVSNFPKPPSAKIMSLLKDFNFGHLKLTRKRVEGSLKLLTLRR